MRYTRLLPLLLLASPLAAQSGPTWGPAPGFLPKGAQFALYAGNPGAAGPFTIRLKLPAGYVIPPHFHPTDENVTVISGHFLVGMGDSVDKSKGSILGPAGFVTASAQMHHFAVAIDDVVVQVHGTGPFLVTYVNPAEDPRAEAASY